MRYASSTVPEAFVSGLRSPLRKMWSHRPSFVVLGPDSVGQAYPISRAMPPVPYPIGFYTKWLDGSIDDPNAGWKGKGFWTTVSTRAPFHMEGGKGTTSKVMKFQLRPNPLAR